MRVINAYNATFANLIFGDTGYICASGNFIVPNSVTYTNYRQYFTATPFGGNGKYIKIVRLGLLLDVYSAFPTDLYCRLYSNDGTFISEYIKNPYELSGGNCDFLNDNGALIPADNATYYFEIGRTSGQGLSIFVNNTSDDSVHPGTVFGKLNFYNSGWFTLSNNLHVVGAIQYKQLQ